ncbi:PTS sugar transporter subunit IIA [Fusibacter bizertensis]
MRKYYLMTHGKMAEGVASTIQMLIGTKKTLHALIAYVNECDISKLSQPIFEDLEKGYEVVVFTDVSHGSVNQYFVPFLKRENLHVITGINLPLVLSIMLISEDFKLEPEMVINEIDFAKEQIIYMNKHTIRITDEDEI